MPIKKENISHKRRLQLQKSNRISLGELSKQIKVPLRYLEVWEVNDLIPALEFHVHELQTIKKTIHSLVDVIDKSRPEEESKTDPIHHNLQKKLKHHSGEYVSTLEKIAEFGAVVDDLDVMAFDFYSWVDGEEIFLCWQSGERCVTHWHYPEEHFQERRYLEGIDIFAMEELPQLPN